MSNLVLAIPISDMGRTSRAVQRFSASLQKLGIDLIVVSLMVPSASGAEELVRRPVNNTDRYYARKDLHYFKVPSLVERINEGVTLFDLPRQPRRQGWGYLPNRIWLRVIGSHLLLAAEYVEEEWIKPSGQRVEPEELEAIAVEVGDKVQDEQWKQVLEAHGYRFAPLQSYSIGLATLKEFLDQCATQRNHGIRRVVESYILHRLDSKITWAEVVAHLAWDPPDPQQQPNPVQMMTVIVRR